MNHGKKKFTGAKSFKNAQPNAALMDGFLR
jgi:hypothetical protein